MRTLLASLGILAAAACDPSASAGDGPSIANGQRSQIGESCATSIHCAEGARCLDQVCRAVAGSTLGEFHTASGHLAMRRGDIETAIEEYTEAVNQYEANKAVEAPAELYCAQGHALVQVRAEKTRGELAARVLHRCLLGAAVGSELRAGAMRDLALLAEVGLDPLLLARDELADAYLIKEGSLVTPDDLKVTVGVDGREPGSRTFEGWKETLATPAVLQALVPCWSAHYKATRDDVLMVSLEHKYTYRLDEYDDFDRSVLTFGDPPAGADPASVAAKCVHDALTPIADEYSKGGAEARWKATLKLRIGE